MSFSLSALFHLFHYTSWKFTCVMYTWTKSLLWMSKESSIQLGRIRQYCAVDKEVAIVADNWIWDCNNMETSPWWDGRSNLKKNFLQQRRDCGLTSFGFAGLELQPWCLMLWITFHLCVSIISFSCEISNSCFSNRLAGTRRDEWPIETNKERRYSIHGLCNRDQR